MDIESLDDDDDDHEHDHTGDRSRNYGSSGGGGRIKVTCAAGVVHTGDILIGADGVNSLARRTMWRMALEKDQGQQQQQQHKTDNNNGTTISSSSTTTSSDHDDPDHPYIATYRCL